MTLYRGYLGKVGAQRAQTFSYNYRQEILRLSGNLLRSPRYRLGWFDLMQLGFCGSPTSQGESCKARASKGTGRTGRVRGFPSADSGAALLPTALGDRRAAGLRPGSASGRCFGA